MRILTLVMAILIFLSGCSSPTHSECLEEGFFLHEGECKVWNDIPEEDKEYVIDEIATEIAVANDITKDEALLWMNLQIFKVMEE